MSRARFARFAGLAVVAAVVVLPLVLVASQVGSLASFSNGSVADATDVNANFAALQAAVNDNDTRLGTFTFGSGGAVGIGQAPQARLDVNGGVRVGNDTICTAGKAGTLRWTGSTLEVCTGTAFVSVSTGGAGALGTQTNPGTSCKAIKTATNTTVSTTYWVDPDGTLGGVSAFEVYCDMFNDGGGWTLVRVDDATSKATVKTAGALGTVPKTLTCAGTNAKLADATIKLLWTEKLRFTTWNDSAGDMTMFSDTSLPGLTSFSDKCSTNNVIRWYFKRAPGTLSVASGTHGEYCGWSFYGGCGASPLCWWGPHEGYKVHLNSSYAHLSIPTNIANLANEQGCGLGWVR